MKISVKSLGLLSIFATLVGCATIMGTPTHLMPISSTPSDANIVIIDEKGTEVFKGTTPTSVTLPKSDGSYWGGKSFTVQISKPGYDTQKIPVKANANGWYIGGNLVFGGLIGWLIVDPLSGNMYSLSPETISSSLSTMKAAHNNTATNGGIAILLIEDVPFALREKMHQIN